MKLDPCPIPYKKINLKWIKDINIRPETVKLLEENIGEKLLDLGLDNYFLDMTPKVTGNKNKNRQMGLHQAKKLLHSKEINRVNRQPMEQEKIFANCTSGKELIFKIYKESKQLNSKKTNNSIKK